MSSDDTMLDARTTNKAIKPRINGKGGKKAGDRLVYAMEAMPGNNSMLSQVTGILIGSPEFQRR